MFSGILCQAKSLRGLARNPEAIQGWLQLHAIAEHYEMKMQRCSEKGRGFRAKRRC